MLEPKAQHHVTKPSHRILRLLLSLCSLPCPLAFAQQNSEAPTPIVTHVNLVVVGATVTDAAGHFVEGLHNQDFHVFDDGVERPIAYFSLDEPSRVLLLIEAGPAVYLVEGQHLSAAFALLAGLSPSDQVAVAKYAERPEVLSDFNTNKQAAASALEHLNFNLGFGALNLSDSLARALDWLDTTQGKKTIVLLSSGVDTSAPEVAGRLLQRLQVGDVRVLAVSLSGELRPTATPKKKRPPSNAAIMATEQFAAADEVLRQLAKATGGRAYFPTKVKEFEAAYVEIAQIVRHEYSLGFVLPHSDGRVHRLEVRVTDGMMGSGGSAVAETDMAASLRVDHRQAYLAPTQRTP
jgi:Ca-activated chloride channel homolog